MTDDMIDLAAQAELLKWATPELLAEVADLDDLHALRARFDPAALAAYVLRDEESHTPINIQPMHEEWHGLANFHDRLLVWAHVEAGKTQQFSIARTLWEIGRNPNIRICCVSNTYGLSTQVSATLAKYITNSPEYKKVFPGVLPDLSTSWASGQFTVMRDGNLKDPTFRSLGVHGNILGARIDLLIIDDILDYENTLTQNQRDDLYNWFTSTLEGRMTRNARILCIGTAWHRDDLMHRFSRRGDFRSVRYPVVDEETGVPSWPERWSAERIERARVRMGPVEFNRSLMCVARSDEESRFKKDWLDQCMARGDGRTLTFALEQVPDGYATFTGVDLGVRTKKGSDLTSLFTIVVHPNGDRELLDITAGRWTGPQIVKLIMDVHHRYNSIVIVENNAAQEFIAQFTRAQSAVPLRSFTTTGKNVRHPQFGLESIATEMSMGKWIIPNIRGKCHPQVRAWLDEMLYYDPSGHPGDRLMSSWFAREGSRMTKPKARVSTLDLLSR